jgi:iron complex transport system permease protein
MSKRIFVLIILLLLSVVATISIGSANVPIHKVYTVLIDTLFNHKSNLGDLYTSSDFQIIWNIRLPRVMMGLIVGVGLSICGMAMQALLLNPIADPYILGVSSGASAGASLALLFPISILEGGYQVTAFAMIGALTSSLLVYSMAKIGSGGRIQPVSMLLSGMAVNAMMSAMTSFFIFIAKSNEGIAAVYNWQMGSIASAQWKTLLLPMLAVITAGVVFLIKGQSFHLLMAGEDEANALGLNVSRFRISMTLFIAFVIATLVSVTGIVGFVGLIIPHVTRMLCKSNNSKAVFIYCSILGGMFVMWADAAARGLFGAAEVPLGIITAFIGGPFFLYLMIKKNKKGGE